MKGFQVPMAEAAEIRTQRGTLHSWKEIASYIRRVVRTIQRYEVLIGLPIHRPAGTSRSAVMAFSDEIDAWLRRAPAHSQICNFVTLLRNLPRCGLSRQ
jgi:hypothetical protein